MAVLDPESGAPVADGEMGAIALRLPTPPGFMTTLFRNDARYETAYLAEVCQVPRDEGKGAWRARTGAVSTTRRNGRVHHLAEARRRGDGAARAARPLRSGRKPTRLTPEPSPYFTPHLTAILHPSPSPEPSSEPSPTPKRNANPNSADLSRRR